MLGRRRRFLFAMAMPSGLFHADRKARALRQKLSPLLDQGLATLDIEPALRADQLQRILRSRRPDVLHIVCHGGDRAKDRRRVLLLEDRRGNRDAVDADELSHWIEQAGIRPELVVLEACGSERIAEELVGGGGVDAAIGVAKDIEPEASTRFFVSLLQALAWGSPIDEAFAEARRDLELLAPSIWSLPVLVPRGVVRNQRRPFDSSALRASLDIDPTRAEEHVSLAEPLRPPVAHFGREGLRERLDHAWRNGEQRIVHLRGPAGTGKTTFLGHWLDRQAQRRWQGATRVFTWSFDPLAEGHGCGSLASFIDRAQDFFGAVDPVLVPEKAEASDAGEWLDGLRLGRAIRHERVLLCLDAVPLLPYPEGDAHGPLVLLPPMIGALLHELARSRHVLCVFTTRSTAVLRMDGVVDEFMGPLDPEAAASLLAQRGVVARREELRQWGRALGCHPATLVTMAEVARVRGEIAAPADVPGVLAGLDADVLLAGLAHGGGSLSCGELRALVGLPDAPDLAHRWDDFDDALLRAVRRTCAVGIARVTDRCGVVLSQSATLRHLPRSPTACAALGARARRILPERLEKRSDIPAHLHAVRLALQRGAEGAFDGVRLYVDDVCQRGRDVYETSYLTRALGSVADDLWFLAEFFEPAPDGSFRGQQLRAGVAEAEPPGGAFLHHRLGTALRHFGRLGEAVAPLRRAFELYAAAGGRFEERAATCANDLAETLAWQGERKPALEWAQQAVQHAHHALSYAEAAPGAEAGESMQQARLARYLCSATLGHVHDRRGEHAEAETFFQHANDEVRARETKTDASFRRLFSRPGYQYWCFLLGRLEDGLGAACADPAPMIHELMTCFEAAKQWCTMSKVARVTRAYHMLARGRLRLLAEEHGLGAVMPVEASREATLLELAQKDLFNATHVLRAHQHLWMLPDALDARERLFLRLGEAELAALDHEEAEQLRASFRRAT